MSQHYNWQFKKELVLMKDVFIGKTARGRTRMFFQSRKCVDNNETRMCVCVIIKIFDYHWIDAGLEATIGKESIAIKFLIIFWGQRASKRCRWIMDLCKNRRRLKKRPFPRTRRRKVGFRKVVGRYFRTRPERRVTKTWETGRRGNLASTKRQRWT